MTVNPLTPSFSQQFKGLELAGSLDGVDVVEARVVSMLEGGKIRLAVLGQTVDVNTSRAFRPGTLIAAAIDRKSGKLEVIAKQNAPEARSAGSGAGDPPSRTGAAGSRIVEALLGIDRNVEGLQPAPSLEHLPQDQLPLVASGPGAQAQLQAEVRTRYGLDPVSASELIDGVVAVAPPSSHGAKAAEPAHALLSPNLSTASLPASGLAVPFQLPQMPNPIPIRIVEEGRDTIAGHGGSSTPRSWAVTVMIEAGTAGLLEVSLKLRENSLSVRLASQKPDGAATLTAWLPELKRVLEQADFTVEELSVAEAPGAGGELAATPDHDRSITM